MAGKKQDEIIIERETGNVRLPADRLGEWLGTVDDQLFILAATAFEAQALARCGGDAYAALEWMEQAAEKLLHHDDGSPITGVAAADGQWCAIEKMRRLVDALDQQDEQVN